MKSSEWTWKQNGASWQSKEERFTWTQAAVLLHQQKLELTSAFAQLLSNHRLASISRGDSATARVLTWGFLNLPMMFVLDDLTAIGRGIRSARILLSFLFREL
ncbi:unnamed protein product [Microthlaspi erraticum]|uniref:Uncharacterized protein n=1 Tax=Microthlaspi erraticum TaxID=1685480 RepID=A0A6D2JG91_9BRAS|nr:unnamed protein product [Microthlaspi erraticum]